MKKRVLSWLLTILLAFSLVTPADKAYAAGNEGSGSEQEQLEYEAVFPDAAFRQQICVGYGFDADNDGIIDDDELEAMAQREVLMLGLSEYYPDPIESLKGIEFFSGLKTLYVNDCGLMSLDITGNTQLKELNCKNNRIETLDLGVNSLTNVWCQGNPGITIDIRNHALLNQAYIKALVGPMGIIPDPDGNFGVSAAEWNEEQNGFDVCASVTYSQDATVLYTPSDPGQQDPVDPNGEGPTIEEMFPDPTFRTFILNQYDKTNDGNNNGTLDDAELNRIAGEENLFLQASAFSIYTGEQKPIADDATIESLEGIQYFSNLKWLDCSGRGITTLDISQNTQLEKLNCADNALSILDVSDDSIKEVQCEGNADIEINLGENAVLNMAYAEFLSGGSIADDDGVCRATYYEMYEDGSVLFMGGLSFSPGATVIYDESYVSEDDEANETYWYSVLQEYDTDNDEALSDEELLAVTRVEVDFWYPETLNGIERLVNLEVFEGEGMYSLTSADLSQNTKLKELTLLGTDLTELDFSANTELTKVNLSGLFETLDFRSNSALEDIEVCLNAEEEEILFGDLSALKRLVLSDYSGTEIPQLASATELTELQLLSANISALDVSALTKLETLSCFNGILEEITGLQNLTSLESLNLAVNKLTTLDVSALTGLTVFYCYKNELTSLKVGTQTFEILAADDNAELKSIDGFENITVTKMLGVGGTGIDSLDVSRFTGLQFLYCYGCGLEDLVLSANTELLMLDCSRNNLESLVITNNPKLFHLFCEKNAISSLDIRNNPKLLTAVRGIMTEDDDACIYSNGTGGMSYYDEPIANMLSIDKDTQIIQGENVPSDEEKETIRMFPDTAFRNYVLKYFDKDFNCVIDEDELELIAAWEDVDLAADGIKDLTGIEYFTGVKNLGLGINELTSLDISRNVNLELLNVARNNLESIDITGIPKLIKAFSQVPQNIALEDGENIYNCDCYSYFGDNGDYYEITVDKGVIITRTYSEAEQATIDMFPDRAFRCFVIDGFDSNEDYAIDAEELANIAAYDYVNIPSSSISDLTGIEYFTGMKYLDCSWNALTDLDLSANKELLYLDCTGNKLTDLDLSDNTKLVALNCKINEIEELDISGVHGLVNAYLSNHYEDVFVEEEEVAGESTQKSYPFISYTDDNVVTGINDDFAVVNNLTVDKKTHIISGVPGFTSVRMVLSDEIGLKFAVTVPEGFEFGAYPNVSFMNQSKWVWYGVNWSEGEQLDANTYVFTYKLNPLEFADTIDAQLYFGEYSDENLAYLNEKYVSYSISAEEYCGMLDANDTELQKLISSLKNYAYAVSQSGWSDGYGHDEIDDELPDYSDEEIEEMKENVVSELFEDGVAMQINLMGSGISDIRVSLSLLDKTIMNIYVLPEDGAEVYDYDDVRYIGGERYYVIRTKPVGPLNLGKMTDIEIGTSVGTLVFKACPMSYVYSFLSGSVNSAKNLAMIMYYEYYQSAVAYQSSRNQ